MDGLLAYAESSDPGSANLVKVLAGMAILAACALLAAVVIGVARSRDHRQAEAIMVTAIFWAMLTAGLALYSASAQYNWSKEYTTRIESGYYDPRDTSDKPKLPWIPGSGLAVAYAGLLGWSLFGRPFLPEVVDQ
jgi:hypothetical protein